MAPSGPQLIADQDCADADVATHTAESCVVSRAGRGRPAAEALLAVRAVQAWVRKSDSALMGLRPGTPDPGLHHERHRDRRGILHDVPYDAGQSIRLILGRLEQQFVVHL